MEHEGKEKERTKRVNRAERKKKKDRQMTSGKWKNKTMSANK